MTSQPPKVVRVIPDVLTLDKEFDYYVPKSWHGTNERASRLVVGSMVRVPLAGRNVSGWVSAVDVESTGVKLSPLKTLRGVGPSVELMELASWAAWRWAGSRVKFLRAASPPKMLAGVPQTQHREVVAAGPKDVFAQAFESAKADGVAVVRTPPNADIVPLALQACRFGDVLLLCPHASRARHLAIALRRAGVKVALGTQDWALAASGATVVGTRSAAWMPLPALAAVVVFDEHDELLREQQVPTWNAREVVLERARRACVPTVLSSPIPSLEALRAGRLFKPERSFERGDWPTVQVLDRRNEDPVKAGLFAERLGNYLRGDRRVVCVLNRKGRSRLLSCGQCGELVRTLDGKAAMTLLDKELSSPDGAEVRPSVCMHCGSTALKNLRAGVSRAREELAALVGEDVEEITASASGDKKTRVVIGTDAVLYRLDKADVVVILDLDQELLAPRQRAVEQIMALLVRAARLLGPRRGGGTLVLQTRQANHEVVRAIQAGNPAIVALAERDRRRSAKLAPYGAQALISGAGAAEFIRNLGQPLGVRILGPLADRYLLQADVHQPLLEALEVTTRPNARLRIEVDPYRV